MDTPPDIDIAQIARLARIELTPEEVAEYRTKLKEIIAHTDSLRGVDVSKIDALTASSRVDNNLREDRINVSFTAEQALANAPVQADGLFIVPRMIE